LKSAATIYTLETAKLNDVDPEAWLAEVLARLQDHPTKRINDLLPGIGSERASKRLWRSRRSLMGSGCVVYGT
jgi:hypothetical protein